tara:strand:+ start:2882 stop:3577 length:696 start_codon:yes stop_codon:yes gene_type:complete
MNDLIEARLTQVTERVARAAERVGRSPEDVQILPVTKGHSKSAIESVLSLGLNCVGENRVPEAEAKQTELDNTSGLSWHLIGRLQRNKARRAVRLFDVIESVDSLRLAETLSRIVEEEDHEPIETLVQVNPSREVSKAGSSPEETVSLVHTICHLSGLRVTGLMTMAPFGADETVLRNVFSKTYELLRRCRDEIPGFEGRVLSMGMSSDFEIAVEEGSTRVRLGTVILGER